MQEERRVTQATKASWEAPAAHSWAMSRNVVEAVDEDWATSDQERRVGLNARPEAVSSRAKMANEWVEREERAHEMRVRSLEYEATRSASFGELPARVGGSPHRHTAVDKDASAGCCPREREERCGRPLFRRSARDSSPLKTCTSDAANSFRQRAWTSSGKAQLS